MVVVIQSLRHFQALLDFTISVEESAESQIGLPVCDTGFSVEKSAELQLVHPVCVTRFYSSL